ncbi:MAG TPA: hypothetical protein VNV87_04380 [Acidimicrobiales bacterium]|jgi:hypothetical protein|nr:hypothetical protein [Acidimicrobiales bacterium]
MVETATRLDNPEPLSPPRRRPITSIALALVVGVGLGYLGWVLTSPGGSLLAPTLIVLGIGLALAGSSWVVAYFTPSRKDLWIFALTCAILSLFAGAWTFWFSLPTAMWSDSGASQQAQNALVKLSREPTNSSGVPINHCWTIETGAIGPLQAPYEECAVATKVTGKAFTDVTFTSIDSPHRSIQYTNSGAMAFYDTCYRHLVGQWWMTTWDQSGLGSCPIGYQFHGGP